METPCNYDDIPIRRSYDREVLQRLGYCRWVPLEELGRVQYGSHVYPLLLGRYPRWWNADNPSVLISAGVHGDEPAGVYALLGFLEDGIQGYRSRCNFAFLPCVNPSGFEAGTHKTMSGQNPNRLFGTGSSVEEVHAVERWLRDHHFLFHLAIDLHEDSPETVDEGFTEEDNVRGCYLYETMSDVRRRIGRVLIDALPPGTEVCQAPEIYQDINDQGVIAYPEACRNPHFLNKTTALADYLYGQCAEHTFTFETPTVWPLEKRIAVQRLWLRHALDLVLRIPSP